MSRERGTIGHRLAAVAFGFAIALGSNALAQQTPLPQDAPQRHLGVATCGGSTCHGAIEPFRQSNVLQNEYVTWTQKDKHAAAYKVLLNERSQRIAKNLGLAKPAHESAECLNCHAHFPAEDKRGPQFQLSDGVACEACHGGAAQWLGPHVANRGNHAENIQNGLYPTEDPVKRAKLCLACHFGDLSKDNKFVTHRIMGAGHPRMSFELDTFTAIQPLHYRLDDDYLKRKPQHGSGVQVWAIGQAMALSELMGALADPKRNRDGIFPELVMFDCHACHHPMSNLRWAQRGSVGLPPGVPRLSDSNLIMLRIIAERISPADGAALRDRGLALHKASIQGTDATVAAAKGVKEVADRLVAAFAGRSFGKEDMQALMQGVLAEGLQKGEFVDYAAAEQATMALQSIVAAMKATKAVEAAKADTLQKALDKLLQATLKDEEYKPETFRAALQEFQTVAGRS
jgi:hypothetical protein